MTDRITLPAPRLTPTGAGIYLRQIRSEQHGRELAKKIAGHGLRFAAFFATWQDSKGRRDVVKRGPELACAEQLERLGVDRWAWGYPDAGHEAEFLRVMLEHARALRCVGILPDVEKPYRSDVVHTEALVDQTLDALDESLGLGVTMFGNPKLFSKVIAKLLARFGWLSPQVYTVEPWRARQLLEQWRELAAAAPGQHTPIIASVPTYGPNSEGNLGAYLGAIEDLVDGAIAWSEPSTSELEWKTLGRWSERLASRPARDA